jgi:hypothetical protein
MSDPSNSSSAPCPPAPTSSGGGGSGAGNGSVTVTPNKTTITIGPGNNCNSVPVSIPLPAGYINPWAITTGGTIPLPFPIVEEGPPVPVAKKEDGCTCKKCKEFYPYAEPNQKDGSLICFGCRMDW